MATGNHFRDNGVRLSGGQGQRIVLARALLREPEILVLDEATSALDNESECKIQKAVEALSGKLTVIIIAHRLSTIRSADLIIVIDQGEIVEQGTYEKLMGSNGNFKRMVEVKG
ncbi:MAG: ATP-binding cassette domain-containing protein [Velocimicrobium sp.]